jgi:branched-chain amino acid transport system substrate-binding protein
LILARKQMADLSVSAPIVTMVTGPAYKEFTEGLGDLANDITSSSWWHQATNYRGIGPWPTTADFYSEFVKQNHNDPDYVHASCAAAIIVLADAIERAGTVDKVKVRDALAATNINTFYGPVKFTANGMNQVRDLPIIQVQNKTIKVLNPADLKNGELQLIKG